MDDTLASEVARHLVPIASKPLGIAVSGGSDSLCLLYILADLRQELGLVLKAVTVDHRLRPEAAEEARIVAANCADLGIPHQTLVWAGWDGQGNKQGAARRARYSLMTEWAREEKVPQIALGHTEDDQAETVLMRLARGAGVDGLSAMRPEREHNGVTWLRPLLSISRTALREDLNRRGVQWLDDPGNDDASYDRIKARRALDKLAPLGIDRAILARVAGHMQSARDALEAQTLNVAGQCVTEHCGSLCINWPRLIEAPDEILRRVVLASLQWVGRAEYPPRASALDGVLARLTAVTSATLDGCLLLRKKNNLWICRELSAVGEQLAPLDALWDGRWRVCGGTAPESSYIGVLGEDALSACENWRDLGLPRQVLAVTPAIWHGQNLVAAPLVNRAGPWQAERQRDGSSLFDALFAH